MNNLGLFVILMALNLANQCNAQETKGVIPIDSPAIVIKGVTRAVVIGISDYHDPAIPDLQFADKDAIAFSDWLQSKAGGSVPTDNIQLLTNEKATNIQIGLALQWLMENSKEGDIAKIYFSGHGDLDSKKMRNQWGFLLTYDTPAKVYIAGAFPLSYLQNVVSTLSIDQKVRVELFLDACHAGKLAGSDSGGRQSTAESLTKEFANEVMLLSCQPNEFSIEGEQWGGGRGAFSYNLIEGMSGFADKNKDGQVTLLEIGRYLEDKVPEQTAPQLQFPMYFGDRQSILARVDATTLLRIQEKQAGLALNLKPVATKGMEEEVLAKADSVSKLQYYAFKNALSTGNLLEPDEQSADFFYNKLIDNETFKPLAGLMTRNFAAALADESQEALNAILADDPYEIKNWIFNPKKYKQYPLYLQRAMDLIGGKNYMYHTLMAKKLYFEGYNIYFNLGAYKEQPKLRDSYREEAKKTLDKCLEYEPGAAYAYYTLGNLEDKTGNRTKADGCIFWINKAMELAPSWKQPYVTIAEIYLNWLGLPDKAEEWLMKAYALDSTSYLVLQELAWVRQYQHKPEEANAICTKMIALRPELFDAYFTLWYTAMHLTGDLAAAEINWRKVYEIESKDAASRNEGFHFYFVNHELLMKKRRQQEAIQNILKYLATDSLNARDKIEQLNDLSLVYIQILDFEKATQTIDEAEKLGGDQLQLTGIMAQKGRLQYLQGQYDEAEKTLLKARIIDDADDTKWIGIWALLGCVKAAQNQPVEAEQYFKKAIEFWGLNEANICWEEAWFLYGQFLLQQNRDAEAKHAFEKTEDVYPNGYFAPYGMALWEAKKGHPKAALDWLEKSLDRYYPIPQPILEEPLFAKIKNTKRFQEMMIKNFPN